MSNKPTTEQQSIHAMLQALWARARRVLTHNWGMKLMCLGLSIVLWGGLISQDGNLTREKTFKDLAVSATNADVLLRSGLIVVDGLDDIPPLQMRAEVPQRTYDSAAPANFNVRVDLSRVTGPGEQMLPILTSSSTVYGQVSWLSQTEVRVRVDNYITRRRIPVQLEKQAQSPAGFYAPTPSVDPAMVIVSGPRLTVEQVVRCVAVYDISRLAAQSGTQLTAVPFTLQDMAGQEVDSSQITVTSEGVLLDTVMVEQQLYPLKTVDINLDNITSGQPAQGYEVIGITAAPAYLSVSGTADFLKSLSALYISGVIDISGATEPLVRAVKVERPPNALHVSEEAIYITVDIAPALPGRIIP